MDSIQVLLEQLQICMQQCSVYRDTRLKLNEPFQEQQVLESRSHLHLPLSNKSESRSHLHLPFFNNPGHDPYQAGAPPQVLVVQNLVVLPPYPSTEQRVLISTLQTDIFRFLFEKQTFYVRIEQIVCDFCKQLSIMSKARIELQRIIEGSQHQTSEQIFGVLWKFLHIHKLIASHMVFQQRTEHLKSATSTKCQWLATFQTNKCHYHMTI